MPSKQSPAEPEKNMFVMKSKHKYYSELARITTGLFVGILALMAFLLTVGLSHPDTTFEFFVYASVVLLPLSLLMYVISQSMFQMALAKKFDTPNKKSEDLSGKFKAVKLFHVLQQLLFVLGLVAVTGLAMATAHFFFLTQANLQSQQGAAQQQAQPQTTDPAATPAPTQ